MCGIMGYIGSRDGKQAVLEGLHQLEYRGYDSAGMAFMADGSWQVRKEVGRVANLEAAVADISSPAPIAIGHTRWATHGEATTVNCHPHSYGSVTLVHNGIIENYREIAAVLEQDGMTPLSETDTEVAALLIGSHYHGDPLKTLKATLPLLEGSYAFCIVFSDRPDTLYAARKGSPIVVAQTDREGLISSDILGTAAYTKQFFSMPEASIAAVTKDEVHLYDYRLKELTPAWETIAWDVEGAQKQGYEYFMKKEIHEQPQAFTRTVLPRMTDGLPDLAIDGMDDELLRPISALTVVGCGTAMHSGLVGKHVIEQSLRLPVQVEIASEFRYREPVLLPGTLAVFVSQSGETADTLAALRLAKEQGVKTLAIVNVKGSSIARESDFALYTHAGPEVAVASTKAYMVQLTAFYLLAWRIGLAQQRLKTEEVRRQVEDFLKLPQLMEKLLADDRRMKKIGDILSEHSDLFFIGRGLDYALSMEGSIKLKEISYIHSEAYAAGELKHGTISLITEEVPCIALATQPTLYSKMISNIREVKTRGAFVVVICRPDFPQEAGLYDVRVELPPCAQTFTPFLAVIYLQLIAYYTSYAKGLDVDHPRNLAKSVTVE
ncbi:MAG: glutamine--fructose-6-phosphate transaminase (isomerizing) [Eubacteriales bacterium]|nr:glutamine--fructose-6-phosphate transaminase (isomerizing) [Eubacteriales bacterium]